MTKLLCENFKDRKFTIFEVWNRFDEIRMQDVTMR